MPATAMPKCLVVQHVAPESPWAIGDALGRAGVTVDLCRVFAGDDVPVRCDPYAGVVVMGGPMSATSDDGFPSRRAELTLLRDALDGGVPTLGVCLGAQLVALAAEAPVFPGADGPEIGWAPVTLSASCREDALLAGLPDRLPVLHWHGDTFELPTGAHHLASSARYPNQAFRVGDTAWGLQFHLEVTAPAVAAFLGAFAEEAALAPGGADAVRRDTPGCLAALHTARDLVLRRFAALVAAGPGAAAPDGSRRRFANISDS